MKFIYIFIILCIIFSCSNFSLNKNISISKYREKNITENLRIESSNGNIDIIGWSKDFIEINTKKKLINGFPNDLKLIDTVFNFNESENELNIKTKIPARIDGRIDLEIFIPYILSKVYIDSKKGNLNINKFLGDLEITNIEGIINLNFQGSMLRVNTNKSKLNLNINSYNSNDIILNSEDGEIKVYVNTIGKKSFLDIIALNSSIELNISRDIEHKLLIKNNKKDIKIKYKLDIISSIDSNFYSSIIGKYGKNFFNDFIIDIISENGVIGLTLFENKKLN